ncbi:hypothetical protein [Desulfosporosinus sp. FKB]|uniref:hypothetical protein n=1 Tax=Desulfosporosinus sp. FKB TaxID=1969835 RepID=UPI000B49F7CA|nr:hypothetical protein [Desulfosporosinus sp. FKB]
MSFSNDSLSLTECIAILFDERPRLCDYYTSGNYERHFEKQNTLDRKIKQRLGKKRWKELFWYFASTDAIHGEQLAELQKSCYKLGFNDALALMGEIERAKNGLSNIFN